MSKLYVRDDKVHVQGYARLDASVRELVERSLGEVDVSPVVEAETLIVPATVRATNLAGLLGRVIRPTSRKQLALERVRSRVLARSYPETLDADEVCRRGRELAALIEERRDELTRVLVAYETHRAARDEIARTIDVLRSLDENRAYFRRRIGEVATFLPCNQPLYALACFGLVPALMASRVYVRPSQTMGAFFELLVERLDLASQFANVAVSRQDRATFIAERSAIVERDGRRVPVTDAVIFTGTHSNASAARKHFDSSVLFIVNGAGHNPIVVTDTANVDRAVASIVRVQLHNQGQDCANPNAILVHRDRYAELLEKLRAALRTIKVGRYDDPQVVVGPLTRRHYLARVQHTLLANARWLDAATPGLIRTRDGTVEPTIIARPLVEGGNFTEQFAPLLFVQRYDGDAELARYFEDPRYALHAMYVSVFGNSAYVDTLVERPIGGRVLHDSSTILRDTDLHAAGVERGTRPYGGYGPGASYVHIHGVTTPKPTLPQRDLFEQLVEPTLVRDAEPPAASSLATLEAKYLDPAIAPAYRTNTRVEALVDGDDYFAAVLRSLRETRGAGDAIYIFAYQIDPRWRVPGDSHGRTLVELLAHKVACGVDVRIALNGTPVPVNPWRENWAAARVFRRAGVAVALDKARVSTMGSHHQKAVVIRSAREVTAFVSGMDPVPDHWDHALHGSKRWPDGTRWGWHDVGVQLHGEAVRRIWQTFRDRWAAAGEREPVPPCPQLAPVASEQSVQILLSSFERGVTPVHELVFALQHAIAAAERYIYIEDQFLCDHAIEHLGLPLPAGPVRIPPQFSLYEHVAERMARCRELKLVCVGSGKSDPIDFLPGERNRRLTPSLRKLIARAGGDRVAVWRYEDATVHSKVVLIDDAFAAIGSGNFRTRSTYGVDSELQVAYVAADRSIARLRATLWGELLGLEPIEAVSLEELDRALGHWHPGWPRPAALPAMRRRSITRVMR